MVGGSLVDTIDEARRRTRELIAAGADVIKVASSAGGPPPATNPNGRVCAVNSSRLWWRRPRPTATGRWPPTRSVAPASKRPSRPVSPASNTAINSEGLRHKMVEAASSRCRPLETMADVTSSPAGQAKSAHWHAVAQESIGASAAGGVKIAVGTDAGLSLAHGTNLKELGAAGALRRPHPDAGHVAAASTSAELCGLAEQVGTVEAGKLADLVIVRGDPLADIDSVGESDNILLVLREGRAAIDRAGFLTSWAAARAAPPPGSTAPRGRCRCWPAGRPR